MCAPSWIGNARWLSTFGICFHQQPPFPGHSACMKKHFRYVCPGEPGNHPGSSVSAREKAITSHFIVLFPNCFFWKYHKTNPGNLMQNFFLFSYLWTGLTLNFSKCLRLCYLIWCVSTTDFFSPPNQWGFFHSRCSLSLRGIPLDTAWPQVCYSLKWGPSFTSKCYIS